ncbi:hypothetical protein IVB18_45190 [Bradyrhizobium sp. 186]|uniref:hypothetical protein n=1 Tax=Bradyrhizobium sp. 186 TaxID=2782654 RepID=UPI0020013CAE|nr:hypothetical protein [Bradyrhizobium sp. 186]UPK35100.1 hypothetical protein IVB18_45190 [Bradyrhizobium sp. 186]
MFRQVDEYTPPEMEHPCQGSLPDLKLDWQPPTQLPVLLAILASCAASDIGDAVAAVGAVREDMVLRLTARCVGL